MFATLSSLKCAALAAALSLTLTACDDDGFADSFANDISTDDISTDTDSFADAEFRLSKCEIRTGAMNPDADGWVYPWLALEYSDSCTEGDLAHVRIAINGTEVGHSVLQMTSLDEPNCAILIFRPYAGSAQPWILEWTAQGDALGSDYVETYEVKGFAPGWSVYRHDDMLTTSPAWYGPRCAVPLDWYLDPKPWDL